MKKLIVPLMSLMMLTSTAAMAFGGPDGHHRGNRNLPEAKIEFLTQKLDLTEDQIAKIKVLQEEYVTPRETMRQEVKDFHKKMQALDVQAPDYNKKLQALADEAGKRAGEEASHRVMFNGKMKTILTAEQREELATMMEKRQKHHGKKEGKHEGKPEGKPAPKHDDK